MTYNGQAIPAISADAELVGCKRKSAKSYSTQLKDFFKSRDFQDFCNLRKNGIKEGSLLWVVRCEYPLLPLEGIKGEINFDFDIITSDVPYLYRATRFVNRPTENEKQIYFSQSYIVRKDQQGKWIVDLILKSDDWLKRDAVKTAFSEVAAVKGYRLVGNVGVFGIKFRSTDTQAWVSIVMTAKGEGRVMACLLDSGRIVDVATTEAELHKTPYPSIVKTKFNWFRYWDDKVLVRN